MARLIKKKKLKTAPVLSLRQFHERRNKVLIIRQTGGLGDMIMHRMMFEDFKKISSDVEIVLACLPIYHNVLEDHPYIDELVDSRHVNHLDYLISYNTTCACTRYEIGIAPKSGLHRSDIWAQHCGVELTKHDAHFVMSPEIEEFGRNKINELKGNHSGPTIMLCPISAMVAKNLTDWQMEGVVNRLRQMGFFVVASHTAPIIKLNEMNVPIITGLKASNLMGVINACDYIVSVDTGQFHCAGVLNKPLTGIFTFADGKVYGKYFDFTLVQKHRENDPEWSCGPCYAWHGCLKSNGKPPKPCLTEITVDMIIDGIKKMVKKHPK